MNNSPVPQRKSLHSFAKIILVCTLVVAFFPASLLLAVEKKELNTPQPSTPIVETASTPDLRRVVPIATTIEDATAEETSPTASKATMTTLETLEPTARVSTATTLTETFGPNLIQNPSWETFDSAGNPTYWRKGGYGTNNRVHTYPVTGFESERAGKVEITSYTTGDAKWYFTDVPVTAGKEYLFSDYYLASRESIVTIRYTKQDGTFLYPTLTTLPLASTFTEARARFTVPQGVVSLTIFHLIKGAGTLTTDEYSLQEVIPASGGIDTGLIQNGDFEQTASTGLPTGWYKGGWGVNTRTYTYPVAGVSGSKAARVDITSRTTGDAKWYIDYIPVEQGVYTYTDSYESNVSTYLTVQYLHSNGSVSYRDVALAPSTSGFWKVTGTIAVPLGVTHLRVFHLLNSVGSLTIDNATLTRTGDADTGIFSTGAVTLAFDDGWLSQYVNVIPKLDSVNLPATFYITTEQMYEDGFIGFMSTPQVQELHKKGYEIGAHSRTHAHLPTLSLSGQTSEISGSRDDLLAMGITSVKSFAYPFGEYNQTTIDVTRNAGFTTGRSTLDGAVTAASDHYQLARRSVEIDTTLAQVTSWVESALANNEWLILTFHQVSNDNVLRYNTKPAVFNSIVDYLVANDIPVVTVAEGEASMAQ